jgi:peptidyl-prolyl cis-trans isomerase D
MFDFFRRHTRLLQFVLLPLIFVAFVLVGIEGYTRSQGGDVLTVAMVGNQRISQQEWDAAQREQLERARAQMPSLEASFFQTPEMRRLSLEH